MASRVSQFSVGNSSAAGISISRSGMVSCSATNNPASPKASRYCYALTSESTLGAAGYSKITTAGNGYQVQLPREVVDDAGYETGERHPCAVVDGILILYPDRTESRRLKDVVVDLRRDQVDRTSDITDV